MTTPLMIPLGGALLGGCLTAVGVAVSSRWTSRPLPLWARAVTILAGAAAAGVGAWASPDPGIVWRASVLAAVCTTAAAVDLADRIIPNELLVAALGVWMLGQAVFPTPWIRSIAGAAFAFGALLALNIVSRGGLGMGDAKLVGVMGLFLPWPGIAYALVWASLAAGLIGIVLLLRGYSRRAMIPFAPFLAFGAVVAMVLPLRIG